MCLRVPHLYDMHSSLPQQLSNFAFSRSRIIKSVFLAMERFMIRRSRVVIVICPSLEETVKAIEPGARTVLIENAPGSGEDEATPEGAASVRRSLNLDGATPMVLYTGTFEPYQGLDLLFAAAKIVLTERPDVKFVLAGGAVKGGAGTGLRGRFSLAASRALAEFQTCSSGCGLPPTSCLGQKMTPNAVYCEKNRLLRVQL